MKDVMNHDKAFAALDAVALDAIDPVERARVMAHVEQCARCRRELAELRETTALLAFASPTAATDTRERIHERLMSRAATDASRGEQVVSLDARRAISSLAWRRAEWIAIAASVLLVVSVGLLASVIRDRENVKTALTSQIASSEHVRTSSDSLRTMIMHRDSVIAELTGKNVAMMTLTSSGSHAPFAHMFWDHARNTWVMVTHDMPDLKPGRTYQLWLVTPNAKISAGTFATKNGEAMIRATYALDPRQLMALAVTEEPIGGMPQPTGPMIIAAQAH